MAVRQDATTCTHISCVTALAEQLVNELGPAGL